MAGKNGFIYDTIVRNATITPIISTDYHPSYPVNNVKHIATDVVYRTKYGTNSGWGYFYITAGNDWIDINDGSDKSVQLTTGNYDAATLAAHIQTKLNSISSNFTVTYSDSTNKFTIARTTNFTLKWLSGSHHSSTCGETIGFYIEADDSGTNTYTADYVRNHNYVNVIIECAGGVSMAATGCVVLGLNLTSAYQIFQFDYWTGAAWSKIGDFSYSSTYKRAVVTFNSVSATKFRLHIRDWTNADHYTQVGCVLLGDYVELSKTFDYEVTGEWSDTSERLYSGDGHLNVAVGFDQDIQGLNYELMSADEAKLYAVWSACMGRNPFVFIRDSSNKVNTMRYCVIRGNIAWSIQNDYFKKFSFVTETVK